MAEITKTLMFSRFRIEDNWDTITDHGGIYCIYACKYNAIENTVSDLRLLYIGEARNIKRRVPQEPKKRLDIWKEELRSGEVICMNWATTGEDYRERIEAALIFQHYPPCNEEYTTQFPFDKTTVRSRGNIGTLEKEITVNGF